MIRSVEQVSARQMTIPVILMRAGVAEAAGAGNVIVDYEKMGEQLAREIPKYRRILSFTFLTPMPDPRLDDTCSFSSRRLSTCCASGSV